MIKPAVFLLIKTKKDVFSLIKTIGSNKNIKWSSAVYGPYQVIAYVDHTDEKALAQEVEKIRTIKGVEELDARMVKIIPQDDKLENFETIKGEAAVLLINVDYKIEKERVVTWNLRKIKGVKWARAMWGPADIIAIVEADNHESMRDLICDDVKVLKGVKNNSTYYCYPKK